MPETFYNASMPEGEIPVALAWAHPLVAEWFLGRFGSPTEPQEQGWPEILAGRTTLISAPTGSGKTLAAFLICLDDLIRRSRQAPLPDETEVLYVSPLKALSNDVNKNLEVPLAEMFGYSTALRSATQGRATYTMEFKHYSEAPKSVAEAIMSKK